MASQLFLEGVKAKLNPLGSRRHKKMRSLKSRGFLIAAKKWMKIMMLSKETLE
jgi:hypothetical protein